MYTAKIENSNGQVLLLTGDEAVYQVVNILGLNPPNAQVNLTTIGSMDGALFNSSKLDTRNLVLTVKINGDIEANRQNLYRYFRTKEWCKFYYKNQTRDVYIEGYVESVECDLFSNSEMAQISIVCPYPYFQSVDELVTDISTTLALFEFPFSIDYDDPVPISDYDSTKITNVFNASESETGVIIEIEVLSDVSDVKIMNTDTGEYMELAYSFVPNDKVIINTYKGSKSITLIRGGVDINAFSALQKGSVFFQLRTGDNFFGYLADGGDDNSNVNILFRRHETYRGV